MKSTTPTASWPNTPGMTPPARLGIIPEMPLTLEHNLDARHWMWLWAKYTTGHNPAQHCTKSIRGTYSKRFSAHNDAMAIQQSLEMDEVGDGTFAAIYLCGVAKQGYRLKQNYPHNLHAVIVPAPGMTDSFTFEAWRLRVTGGRFAPVPGPENLPEEYRKLPDEYTTCRIFRWAVVARPDGARLFG